MEENEIIEQTIKQIRESISFFSNPNKSKREIWVLREFLKNLNIDFQDNELRAVDSDPPDLIFRDASFEIKEIDEKNRKRHDEYNQELKEASSARNLKDLSSKPYKFKNIKMQEIVDRVNNKLKEIDYSLDFCKNTNILFYINYSITAERFYQIPEEDIWLQWCSISIVTNNNFSYVFCANEKAPEFLRFHKGFPCS